ncbi:MAG: hypothetical protein V3S89_14490 [Desulfobacterales bacterium]
MKKKIIIATVVLILLIIVAIPLVMKGPDTSQYEFLRVPRMTSMPAQKMIVVEAKGDPNEVAGKAFGLLFETFYKVKGDVEGMSMAAPRGRWAIPVEAPKSQWIGQYGLPVPQQLNRLPDIEADPGYSVSLEIWDYGDVAEILHIGAYDKEEPTIARLAQFIEDSGYVIIGEHEEEYVKGPGMFFKGNPEKYYTIIRNRVKKADMGPEMQPPTAQSEMPTDR